MFNYMFQKMTEWHYFKKIQDFHVNDYEIWNQTRFKRYVIEKKINNVSKINYVCKKCRKESDNEKVIKFVVPEKIIHNR